MVGGRRVIRNSILPIIRITETDIYGKRHLLGTIKLSNMIPVPKCKLVLYDLDKETDEDYRNLVLKEKRFINRNKEMIIAHAETLYREKCSGTNAGRGYLKDTFDFAAFEKYITVHYSGEDME